MGAALIGIEESMIPAVPVVGNCYEADVPQLPDQWATGNTIGVELIYYARDFFQPTVLPGQFTCFQSQLNLVNCWRHTARIRQGNIPRYLLQRMISQLLATINRHLARQIRFRATFALSHYLCRITFKSSTSVHGSPPNPGNCGNIRQEPGASIAVSYTHLTLSTIYSV